MVNNIKTIENKTRNRGIDYLRVLASIFVVGTHTISQSVLFAYEKMSFNWWSAEILRFIFATAVPLFVLISGANLLNRDYDNFSAFYKNRFIKVIIPYLLYSIPYLGVYFVKHSFDVKGTISYFFSSIIDIGVSPHFWYMNLLIMIYLFTPFLAILVKRLSDNQLLFMVALMLISFEIRVILDGMGIKWSFIFDFFINTYVKYYIMGYAVVRLGQKYKKQIYILSIIGFLAMLYLNTLNNPILKSNIADLRITMVMFATGIFTLFYFEFNKNCNKIDKIVDFLGKYSFSIYLIHFGIIGIVLKLSKNFANVWIQFVILFVGVYILSLISAVIIDNTVLKLIYKLIEPKKHNKNNRECPK